MTKNTDEKPERRPLTDEERKRIAPPAPPAPPGVPPPGTPLVLPVRVPDAPEVWPSGPPWMG